MRRSKPSVSEDGVPMDKHLRSVLCAARNLMEQSTINLTRVRPLFRTLLAFALLLTTFVWSGVAAAAPAAHGGEILPAQCTP